MNAFILVLAALLGATVAEISLQSAAEDPQVLQALFSNFRKANHRDYKTPKEARMRLSKFRSFVKKAAKLNAAQDDVKVGVTFFADLTEDEKMSYLGANATNVDEASYGEYSAPAPAYPRSTVSHRRRFGPIKNQGQCGSCWCFGAVGVVEGYQAMATGRTVSLSEQQVLDCSGAGNCRNGGYHSKALSFIQRTGHLAATSSYRYTARDGRCSSRGKQNAMSIKVTRVSRISGGDNGLARALASGPAAVLLYNFHGLSVEGYQSGVIQQNWKPSSRGPSAMNHIVVAVGYRSDAWELRNSWGTNWGQRGWFWHSRRKNNNIGVSDHAYTISYSRSGQEEEKEE